jgi:hypothetical protein
MKARTRVRSRPEKSLAIAQDFVDLAEKES